MAHQHSVYDTDPHFKIDGFSMAITDQSEKKTKLMQGDHNSSRFTFEIPRRLDGHDMTLCNQIQVHFLNIDSATKESHADVYLVEDMGISPASDKVAIFSWLVSRASTKYAGLLNFRIRFACIGENGEELYAKHTDIFKGMPIGDGYNHSAAAVEEYSDVLAKWQRDLFEQGSTSVANVNVAREAAISAVQDEAAAQIAAVEAKGAATLESIPDDFSAVAAEAEANTAAIVEVDEHRAALESRTTRQAKLIKNLSQAIQNTNDGITPEPYDNAPAFKWSVPENALPFAKIREIGGVTRKCTNLASPFTIGNSIDDATGAIISRTTCASTDLIPIKQDESYFWSGIVQNLFSCVYFYNADKAYMGRAGANAKSNITITKNLLTSSLTNVGGAISYIRLWQGENANFDGTIDLINTAKQMLNPGETAQPYEPYFEGLRSAPVYEVVSEGVNIWDEVWENGYFDKGVPMDSPRNICSVNFIRVEPNTTYFARISTESNGMSISYFDEHKTFLSESNAKNETFTTPNNCKYIKIYVYTTTTDYGKTYSNDICINKYDTAINGKYFPYIKRTLTMPETVKALPDYGVGIPGTDYFNRIRWRYDEATDKWVREYVKRVGCVDMGTLDWSLNYTGFNGNLSDVKTPNYAEKPNILASSYNVVGGIGAGDLPAMADKAITINYTLPILYVKDSTYTDVASFKAAMSGVMLVYELATPEITDISDILPEDNLLGVEAWGTITAENEFGYAVPMIIK